MYSWPDVARRTSAVYDRIMAEQCTRCSRNCHKLCQCTALEEEREEEEKGWGGGDGEKEGEGTKVNSYVQSDKQQQGQGQMGQQQPQEQMGQQQHRHRQQWRQRHGCLPKAHQCLELPAQAQQHVCAPCPACMEESYRQGQPEGDAEDGTLLQGCTRSPTPAPCHHPGCDIRTSSHGTSAPPGVALSNNPMPAHGQPASQPHVGCEEQALHKDTHLLQGRDAWPLTSCPQSSFCCHCNTSYIQSEAARAEAAKGGVLLSRLASYWQRGCISGLLYGALAISVHLWWCYLQWSQPACKVQVAPDFPSVCKSRHKKSLAESDVL